MNSLGDTLKNAFAADEVTSRRNAIDPRRTVAAIRRRRTARAAGMGTASAFGIAAVGVVWWLGPGAHFASPADPFPTLTCAPSIYVPPNPAARGDLPFALRAYVDLRPDSPDPEVVAVLPDGTATEVAPNADGDFIYAHAGKEYLIVYRDMDSRFRSQPTVLDYTDEGNAGGTDWDGVHPPVEDYKWTTVVPAHVPEGVNTEQLSMTLAIRTLGGGMGYLSDSVPIGAYTDAVVTTADGEEVTRLAEGDLMPETDGRADVISVALRVGGLPGGETFAIVATYDAEGAPPPSCGTGTDSLDTVTSSPLSTASEEPLPGSSEAPGPGISQGP